MDLKDDILQAKTVERYSGWGRGALKLEWLIINANEAEIKIEEMDHWLNSQLPSQRPWDATTARFYQRIGARIR